MLFILTIFPIKVGRSFSNRKSLLPGEVLQQFDSMKSNSFLKICVRVFLDTTENFSIASANTKDVQLSLRIDKQAIPLFKLSHNPKVILAH